MARGNLNHRQLAYAQIRARGVERQQSAVLAGYADADNAGVQVEESHDVQAEIERLRAETAVNAGVTKEMVAEGLKDAAELAKQMADPSGMVAAWRELGKLLGFYAPAVKKLEKGINKHDLLRAMDELSDAELLQMRNGRVVDGKITEKSVARLQDLSEKPA